MSKASWLGKLGLCVASQGQEREGGDNDEKETVTVASCDAKQGQSLVKK